MAARHHLYTMASECAECDDTCAKQTTNIYILKEKKRKEKKRKETLRKFRKFRKLRKKKTEKLEKINECFFLCVSAARTFAYRCESFEDRVIQIEFEGLHGKLS